MATLNIGGDPNDRSYRYKMPRLVAKVEGRGNGIKTRVVNCAEIAASLHRKPQVLIKFFGCELGAQSRWDEKEEAAIVNGAFEGNILQEKLCDSFLPKFVLCPNCGLPETDMKVKKEIVRFVCAACGYAGDADMGHKLITFILADNKKGKEAKKKEKKKEKKEGGGSDGEKADKKEKSADKEAKKEKSKDKEKSKEKKEKKKEKKEKKKEEEEEDEEDWFCDISEEAVEARRIEEMKSMSHSAAAMMSTEPKAKVVEEPVEVDPYRVPAEELEDLAVEEEEEEEEEAEEGVFADFMAEVGVSTKAKQLAPKVESWAEDLPDDVDKAEAMGVILRLPANIAKHAVIVLKALYDNDVVTDEEIFAWYGAADQEHAAVIAAKPFVDFLRE